jgi:hypothetical protein
MGQTRAKYGGVLVKKTEQGSELCLTVMAWRDMITDQVDARSGVKIFRDYYTPADLKKMEAKGWKAETAASLRKHSRSLRANERPRVAAKDQRGCRPERRGR